MNNEQKELLYEEEENQFSLEIEALLQKFIGVESIVCVFDHIGETDRFKAGFVQGVSDEHVLLAHVTRFGKYDGYRVINLEDIFKVEYGNNYAQKLEKLYSMQKQSHPEITLDTESLLESVLWYAYNNSLVISGEINYSDDASRDLQGYVSEISDEVITIDSLDTYGKSNGTCVGGIDDITELTCDSGKEMALRLLSDTEADGLAGV